MKFSDLFVPRYMHSNPDVRRQAVDRIDDAKLLQQISQKDEDAGVRQAAAARLVTFRESA
jgi:hypothetical protein